MTETTRPSLRIVVADDESIIRMDLREMLSGLGYSVVGEAGDGQTAINVARETRPDLVIMDIKMPGVDGIAAARELTKERVAPVLLLTAYSEQDLVERAKEAGVVAYLVKPFREAELMPSIEVALSRFAEFRAVEQEVHQLMEQVIIDVICKRPKHYVAGLI